MSIINLTGKTVKIKIEWENSSVCPYENFEIEALKVKVIEYLSKCGKVKKITATDCGTLENLEPGTIYIKTDPITGKCVISTNPKTLG